MRLSSFFKVFPIVVALGVVGITDGASADDDDRPNPGEVVTGIIGEVIGGAIEAEQAREAEARCEQLDRKCEQGSDWACDKFEESCD